MNAKLHKEIIERDKHCVLCDSFKGLEVHHFHDLVPGLGEFNAYENEVPELLDLLCQDHHGWINGAKGKKNWETRRALILYKFKVDIGFCRWHRFALRDGNVVCIHCGKLLNPREAKPSGNTL